MDLVIRVEVIRTSVSQQEPDAEMHQLWETLRGGGGVEGGSSHPS